jgi:hypothetical protein
MENTNNEKRVINISQREVASFVGMGWSRDQIATYYNISSKEMYGYMQQMGFYKARVKEVDYVVNLQFDMPTAPVAQETTEEVANGPGNILEPAFEETYI